MRSAAGGWPENAKQAYQAHSLQQRLRFPEVDVKAPPRKVPRCAFLEGFSLPVNTHLHANNREGLERLCRYGARGALALERFEEAEDGAVLYRMKLSRPDGATHLRFTGLELLRRPRTSVGRESCGASVSAGAGTKGRPIVPCSKPGRRLTVTSGDVFAATETGSRPVAPMLATMMASSGGDSSR